MWACRSGVLCLISIDAVTRVASNKVPSAAQKSDAATTLISQPEDAHESEHSQQINDHEVGQLDSDHG